MSSGTTRSTGSVDAAPVDRAEVLALSQYFCPLGGRCHFPLCYGCGKAEGILEGHDWLCPSCLEELGDQIEDYAPVYGVGACYVCEQESKLNRMVLLRECLD